MPEIPAPNPDLPRVLKNPRFAVDFGVRLPNNRVLRAIGYTRDDFAYPGDELDEVVLMIGRDEDDTFVSKVALPLRGSVDSQIPIENQDWLKDLMRALTKEREHWLDEYSLADVMQAIVYLSEPGSGDLQEQWVFYHEGWIDEVISRIHHKEYMHVWDEESHRQDGQDWFEEWEKNTRELRGGKRFPWDRR